MFLWKEKYSCNVQVIDEQHKKLFSLGRNLYELIELDDGYDHYDEIIGILNELKNYTIYHFKCEEALLLKHEFSILDFKLHRLEHKTFLDKISSYKEEDIDRDQKKALMDMLTFIADWIEKHILDTDMNYKDFFNNRGVI